MVVLTPLGLARQISNFGYHLEETQAPVSFHRIPKALRRQSSTTAPRPISAIGSPNNSTLRFPPHHKTTSASDNPSIFVCIVYTPPISRSQCAQQQPSSRLPACTNG